MDASQAMNGAVGNVVSLVLQTIIERTTIDDMLIDVAVSRVRELIPGETVEPIMGKLLVQIGEKLQANPTPGV